jgi:hypothetical protein
MKEKIEKKLQENIERILKKEELTAEDVQVLTNKLFELKREENKEENEEKRKIAYESLINLMK